MKEGHESMSNYCTVCRLLILRSEIICRELSDSEWILTFDYLLVLPARCPPRTCPITYAFTWPFGLQKSDRRLQAFGHVTGLQLVCELYLTSLRPYFLVYSQGQNLVELQGPFSYNIIRTDHGWIALCMLYVEMHIEIWTQIQGGRLCAGQPTVFGRSI